MGKNILQNEANPGTGLDMGHLAQVLEDRKGSFKASVPKPWENLKNIDVSVNESIVTGNYDNMTKVAARSQGDRTITVTKDDITNEDKKLLFGAVEVDGIFYGNDGENAKNSLPVAFGYRRKQVNSYRLTWLFKCRAALGDESISTEEKGINLTDATITFAPLNRLADGEWHIWKDVPMDEWTEEIAENWFSKATLEKLLKVGATFYMQPSEVNVVSKLPDKGEKGVIYFVTSGTDKNKAFYWGGTKMVAVPTDKDEAPTAGETPAE